MKTQLYRNKLGIFLFSPPREIFPVIYNEAKTMNFTIFQPPIYLV
jgi:hypothetical protein